MLSGLKMAARQRWRKATMMQRSTKWQQPLRHGPARGHGSHSSARLLTSFSVTVMGSPRNMMVLLSFSSLISFL